MIQEPVSKSHFQTGASLILVIAIAAVIAIVLYFIYYPIQLQMNQVHRDLAKKRLDLVTFKILGTIQNDSAWRATISNNPEMACLTSHSCSDSEFALNLYTADNTLLLPSSNPDTGFNLQGNPCLSTTPFRAEATHLDCPFQVRLFWRPSCIGCRTQEAQVRAEVKIVSHLIFSPLPYIEKMTLTRSQYVGTLDKICNQMGGRFNQESNKCDFPFYDKNCVRGQKLVGITEDSTEIICVETPAITLTPCANAASGFNSDGSLRCL